MSNTVSLKTICFCDIKLVNLTRTDFASFAIDRSRELKGYISFSLNGESLAKFHNDKDFAKIFSEADFVHADGMSIVSASNLVSSEKLPERIATTDWFHDVASKSEGTQISHYFVGGSPATISKTIANVKEKYPKLNVIGFHHGYYKDDEVQAVLDDINSKSPNFIWVGLGRPRQELFALLVRDKCKVGLIKTCGGLFDFLAGTNRRAPMAMQKMGLEWLFRLYLQPRRLFKRYLVTNYQSIKIMLYYLITRKNKALSS